LFTAPQETYWGQFEDISRYNVHLNLFERLWAAWYAYMQNDVLATGILSFVMHELVYFGRSIPWAIIDRIPYFNKYKIQNVRLSHRIPMAGAGRFELIIAQQKIPTAQEQWNCAKLVLLSHFTVELPQIWCADPSILDSPNSLSLTLNAGFSTHWPNTSASQQAFPYLQFSK